ncbi:ABC transporter ATP-binding protein [Asanoa sp. NPDC050611]|uniref:ABC transporter ATP-binding protein n=1 Tax=Asanoa sp. NPDC050611 TaxID=3157098 RepID=UPI00340EC648
MSAEPVLAGRGVTRRFGGVTAVSDVDVEIRAGEVTLVLGPNGAGKSTLVNCLTGVDRPDEGRVLVSGADVTGRRPDQFNRMGVVRTFQHTRPFGGLTVAENVMVGAHGRTKAGFVRGTLRTPGARREEAALRAQADELLEQVGLAGRGVARPVDLPLADERRVEIARCLAAQPRVLLLDEPAAGLGEAEADALADLVRRLCAEYDLGVLLIEHHLELALGMADSVVVLDFGKVIARGTPAEIREDAAVRAAYVGVEES